MSTSPPSDLLGQLANLHQLLLHLAEQTEDDQLPQRPHPELSSLAHLLGQCVYRELYWLREIIQGDDDLSQRIAHLFRHGEAPLAQQCAQMPPKDHLLNWATEILDHHLVLLANPGQLPEHPLMEQAGILHFIVQEHARTYEQMLSIKLLLRLAQTEVSPHHVWQILEGRQPAPATADVDQGAYRIGNRTDEPAAFDNELPPQVIELGGYRIATQPVSNAEYLAFMEAGGYGRDDLWDEAGLAWRRAEAKGFPLHWRRDEQGHWYGLSINGAADLVPTDPVQGLCQHEARAFAAWASGLDGPSQGAVLPHEFQWEAAIRTRAIPTDARVWEWCANLFSPYQNYQAPAHSLYATMDFDGNHIALRGGSLHTQPALRRPAYRHRGRPHWNHLFAGCRLVLPPSKKAWEKT